VGDRDQARARAEEALERRHVETDGRVDRRNDELDAEPIAQHLPGNDVGVVLELGDEDFVARFEECPSTSYLGVPSSYETNSSDAVSLKSLIGNTDLKTACRPTSARSSVETPTWRKSSYERSESRSDSESR